MTLAATLCAMATNLHLTALWRQRPATVDAGRPARRRRRRIHRTLDEFTRAPQPVELEADSGPDPPRSRRRASRKRR